MYTDLNKKPIYDNTEIGFAMDYFSPITKQRLASSLASEVRKKVSYNGVYKYKGECDGSAMRLYPNFFGGFKMNTVESGLMPYNEGLNCMLKTMNFIGNNGFTTEKCKARIRIRINGQELGAPTMEHMNVAKFVINMNEKQSLKFWNEHGPDRFRQHSVKYIFHRNAFASGMSMSMFESADSKSMVYPVSKYFGINFDALKNGYAEIKYVGGKNYHTRKQNAVDIVNDAIETAFESMKNPAFTESERITMREVIREQKSVIDGIKTYENFIRKYPLFNVYVDLKSDAQIIRQKYPQIREKLFELLVYGNARSGQLNYDSKMHRFQMRDTTLRNAFAISGIDFFESKIEGDMTDCGFFMCEIRNSVIRNSTIYGGNSMRGSAVFECKFEEDDADMRGTYIDNPPDKVIRGKITESVVRRGVVSMSAEVDAATEMVEAAILAMLGK